MNRKEVAIKGSAVGIASQIVDLLAKFIVRTLAIRILGRDILGLDSVLIDVISMLSLAEMGVTSAMLFRLYAPVNHGDTERISAWMAAYRLIYRGIAVLVLLLGICVSFALPFFIKDIDIPWSTIYIAFYLQLANTVSSYLLAYQRILLNADQKKHLCILVDLAANILFSIGRLLALALFSSYLLYLVMAVLQTVTANVVLRVYAGRHYSALRTHTRAGREDLRLIFGDTKNILANKLAGYVYSSTDNLIISTVLGTGIVGLLSNYKYISIALRALVASTMSTIQPLIGSYLNADTPKEESFQTLKRYTFIRFVIACLTAAPFVALADTFVVLWSGSTNYLMPATITVLLMLDYYISCVYGPLGEYILGMGMFRQGKYASYAGAVANLVFSLVGVYLWGCSGVLLGTVISQLVIWAADAYIILFLYYAGNPGFKVNYLLRHLSYLAMLTVSLAGCFLLVRALPFSNLWEKFILGAVICELITAAVLIVANRKTDEYKYAYDLFKRAVTKLGRH